MIPSLRSLSELMVLTEFRARPIPLNKNNKINTSTVDSAQRKRYLRSIEEKKVDIPKLPKTIRQKWKRNKETLYKFLNEFDYNNQIQSSYDLTLLERQNNRDQQDAA